ncbi:sialate O-acetylesterase [Paenibacillus sp. TRM 82003]|nr:sialate O-acetylesterase [Paenibacillus sp. TRM 82003]
MRFTSLIGDGMVLQRETKVAIGGNVEGSGRSVEVRFLDSVYETRSDAEGRWQVELEPTAPGGPHEMSIRCDGEETVVRDILVGDVFVLGGQSNMELPLRRTLDLFEEELRAVDEPFIRQFHVALHADFHAPQEAAAGGQWRSATGADAMGFSAAGFFCARELYAQRGVPIGLVLTAVGGTPIEAWMSEPTLRDVGGYDEELARCKDDAYVAAVKREDEARGASWHQALSERDEGLRERWYEESYDDAEWDPIQVPGSWTGTALEPIRGAVWFRKEVELPAEATAGEARLALGTLVDADDTYVNGVHVGSTGYRYPPRRYVVPEGVLRPGKNVIAVRVISTQSTGEWIEEMPYRLQAGGKEFPLDGTWRHRIGAEVEELQPQTFFHYKPSGLYNGMIAPLRGFPVKGALWYQGESNTHRPEGYSRLFERLVDDWRRLWSQDSLPFVYVQLPSFGVREPLQQDSKWAELREEQRQCLRIPHTAMAVAIDLGEWNDIHPQDKKSVGQRLALCARELVYGESLVSGGPLYRRAEPAGKSIRITFDRTGGGLVARGGALRGFAVRGSDGGAFVPAEAAIEGDAVVVDGGIVGVPTAVRYAWADNPVGANLYNAEGLPASPFQASLT